MRNQNKNQKGFTLMEILVIISIIGFLSVTTLASMYSAREKARIARALIDLQQVARAVQIYYNDTGTYPATCNRTCTESTDPFLNSLGVANWKGPYMSLWNMKHPWNGHVNFYRDTNGPTVSFDGDPPLGGENDNTGIIPSPSIIRIDQAIDDGNTGTGKIRINLNPECNALGEVCYSVTF